MVNTSVRSERFLKGSARSRHFSLFGGAKIGASATLCLPQFSGVQEAKKCLKTAESPTETLVTQTR